jgi:hypothetical protein
MEYTWIDIVAILILLDSMGALWFAWFGNRWFIHHMGVLAKYIPPAKGWALWYFILACFILFLTLKL